MGRTSIQAAHIDGQYRKKAAKSRMSDISKSAHTHTHAFSLVVGEHSVVCGGGGGGRGVHRRCSACWGRAAAAGWVAHRRPTRSRPFWMMGCGVGRLSFLEDGRRLPKEARRRGRGPAFQQQSASPFRGRRIWAAAAAFWWARPAF